MTIRFLTDPDTLKVGDIISRWANNWSGIARKSLGTQLDGFPDGGHELQRLLIVEIEDNTIKTSVLYSRDEPLTSPGFRVSPGSSYSLTKSQIRGYWIWSRWENEG